MRRSRKKRLGPASMDFSRLRNWINGSKSSPQNSFSFITQRDERVHTRSAVRTPRRLARDTEGRNEFIDENGSAAPACRAANILPDRPIRPFCVRRRLRLLESPRRYDRQKGG